MNDIPNFEDALVSFRRFLTENGHPTDVVWVFRDEIWKRSLTDVLMRYPSGMKNLALAQKVFDEGRKKGLVQVRAIATVGDKTVATVWFPKFPNEEVQGWDCGMRLWISKPLARAKTVGALRWWFFRFLPRFRCYQRWEFLIGTKAWASA